MIQIWKSRNWTIAGVTSFLLFLALTFAVMLNSTKLNLFDTGIQQIIQKIVNPIQTNIFAIITFMGSPLVDIVLTLWIALFFWHTRNRKTAIWILITQLLGDAIAFFVKEFVQRVRPTKQLVPDTGFSYPSGHTFSTALLCLTILFIVLPYIKKQKKQFVLAVLTVIWFCLVAFSRIYLRNHFPSDVLASLLLALSWWTCMYEGYLHYSYQSRFI
ncbi:phosphatase PAP2 family protein [Pediococcus ethanolidurans]|uniref:phosphatase PAP2 family protein n=1 Tax=Pediococcus ethanolidurans TaxID=319653 RepID=UPI002954A7EA|nr:phosphatase PAP2 family protein [Pediococcus ethanolidurans]MDV7719442.1 phosphatase PAP2 family protein [Pediococcus ethanolidurans]